MLASYKGGRRLFLYILIAILTEEPSLAAYFTPRFLFCFGFVCLQGVNIWSMLSSNSQSFCFLSAKYSTNFNHKLAEYEEVIQGGKKSTKSLRTQVSGSELDPWLCKNIKSEKQEESATDKIWSHLYFSNFSLFFLLNIMEF